jgi:hypothetical protein
LRSVCTGSSCCRFGTTGLCCAPPGHRILHPVHHVGQHLVLFAALVEDLAAAVVHLAQRLAQDLGLALVLDLGDLGEVGEVGEVELEEARERLRQLDELGVLGRRGTLGSVALQAVLRDDLGPHLLLIEGSIIEALVVTAAGEQGRGQRRGDRADPDHVPPVVRARQRPLPGETHALRSLGAAPGLYGPMRQAWVKGEGLRSEPEVQIGTYKKLT